MKAAKLITLNPGERPVKPVVRTVQLHPKVARVMDGHCEQFNIAQDQFINHAIGVLCNGMDDSEIVMGILKDWRLEDVR
jgi:hypothetical protein